MWGFYHESGCHRKLESGLMPRSCFGPPWLFAGVGASASAGAGEALGPENDTGWIEDRPSRFAVLAWIRGAGPSGSDLLAQFLRRKKSASADVVSSSWVVVVAGVLTVGCSTVVPWRRLRVVVGVVGVVISSSPP